MAGAWLMGLYLANMYVRAGSGELDGDRFWVGILADRAYPSWFRILIDTIEIVGGAALIVPRLAPYGAFVLCVVMAGAGGTLAHDARWAEVGWVAAYVVGLAWIAYEWRWVRWGRATAAVGTKATESSSPDQHLSHAASDGVRD